VSSSESGEGDARVVEQAGAHLLWLLRHAGARQGGLAADGWRLRSGQVWRVPYQPDADRRWTCLTAQRCTSGST
jgi:hypothetical protein